jgi:hypothetical protein
MSQLLGDTELDALAAEYVLGTLDRDERAQAQELLGVDESFSAKVRLWERRFAELHLMVEPIDPGAEIWERIKGKLADVRQSPAGPSAEPSEPAELPEEEAPPAAADQGIPAAAETIAGVAEPAAVPAAAVPAAAAPAPALFPEPSLPAESLPPAAPPAAPAVPVPEALPAPAPTPLVPPLAGKPAAVTAAAAPFPSAPRAPLVVDDEREARIRRRIGRWRALSTLVLLAVIALAGLVAAWRFAPQYVPQMLQPIEALRALGIGIDAGPPPPPPRPPRPPLPPGSDYQE